MINKNFFTSKTFWTIVCTVTVAITPKLGQAIEDKKLSASELISIIGLGAGAGLSLIYAYRENDGFYTPNGLPGRNKSNDQNSDKN
jgi:hypothetical protein